MSKNMKQWKMIKAAAGWKRRVQRAACIQILHSKYSQLISTEQDNMYNVWSCKSLLLKQKQSMKSWFRTEAIDWAQKQLYNTFQQQLRNFLSRAAVRDDHQNSKSTAMNKSPTLLK